MAATGVEVIVGQGKVEWVFPGGESGREESGSLARMIQSSEAFHPIGIPSAGNVGHWVVLGGQFTNPEDRRADLVMPAIGRLFPGSWILLDDLRDGWPVEGIGTCNEAFATRVEKLLMVPREALLSC